MYKVRCCNISIWLRSDCKRHNVSKACLFLILSFHRLYTILRASVGGCRGQTTHKTCRLSIPSPFMDYERITKSTEYNLLFYKPIWGDSPADQPGVVARDNHFHIAVLLATQNRWSRRRGLRREPRIWSSKGCGLSQVECKRRQSQQNSDAGSKLGVHFHYKDGFSFFPVVIGHFGNSLSSSDTSVLQRKSFITAWQMRAEKKNFA